MVTPKKQLGQHFLTDSSIAEKVAFTLENHHFDRVIEVGCGKGILTDFLFDRFDQKVLSLDVDEESVAYMHQHHPKRQNQVVLRDFLSFNLSETGEQQAIIGNYPYNISTQIVFHMLDHLEFVPVFSGMFQKEVAERLCAAKGSKTYGILSVLLNTFYTTQYCFTVKEGSFFPPPKVKSGVILAVKKKDFTLPIPYRFYKTVVKTAFNQRRKMLRNSLSSLGISKISDDTFFTMRPEQLSFVKFIQLSKHLYSVQ